MYHSIMNLFNRSYYQSWRNKPNYVQYKMTEYETKIPKNLKEMGKDQIHKVNKRRMLEIKKSKSLVNKKEARISNGVCGFVNEGNTCYMGASLRCLASLGNRCGLW